MSTSGLSPQRLRRMRDVLAGHVRHGTAPGLVALVCRRGEVHVEAVGTMAFGGADPMRRDAIFRIASMTKPILAAATMTLVEECALRLDDPVDRWLPELADRRVLTRPDAPLDDTVAAERPIQLRDLLTLRLGIGMVLAAPGTYPIQRAITEAGLEPGPDQPALPPDEWLARLGALPLVHQPGQQWMYHTGFDVLCVLLARATGRSLADLLAERVFEPLGMRDTGFHVPADRLHRLPVAYRSDPESGAAVYDDPAESPWRRPPVFHSELASTADDYLAFCQMMLDSGRHAGGRLLSRPSVELMTTDQLTPQQRAGAGFVLGDGSGWGFGVAVTILRDDLAAVPGRFGWDGGLGTSAYCDPAERLVGILLTQRMMDSPDVIDLYRDFWTSAYQAIDD